MEKKARRVCEERLSVFLSLALGFLLSCGLVCAPPALKKIGVYGDYEIVNVGSVQETECVDRREKK